MPRPSLTFIPYSVIAYKEETPEEMANQFDRAHITRPNYQHMLYVKNYLLQMRDQKGLNSYLILLETENPNSQIDDSDRKWLISFGYAMIKLDNYIMQCRRYMR